MEPNTASAIQTLLQGAGFLGAAILALGWACLTLYRRLEVMADKRVEDAQRYAEGMAKVVEVLREHTSSVNRVADVLEREGISNGQETRR